LGNTVHPDKGPYIQELSQGDHVIGFYTLENKNLEPFRDPSRGYFLAITIGDRSGHIQARVWEDAERLAGEIEAGMVLKIEGDVESYMDREQIIILRARRAEPGEYDLRDMAPSSNSTPEEMRMKLDSYLVRITEPNLKALLDHFFMDPVFQEAFYMAPAARRIHHAYLGGLAEHTLEVLQICSVVLEIYPQIDADLLLAGAMLHDIGKLSEYTWGVVTDFSSEGRLIGHIVIADRMVSDAISKIPDFPEDLALRLRHMLVAHHGRQEWGSPREPRTLEAIALHHIENLDAQINRFNLILESRKPGESWTKYDRLLGRQLYAGDEELDLE
jgi:3'-5' exoribonuclease